MRRYVPFVIALVALQSLSSCEKRAEQPFHQYWKAFQEAVRSGDADQVAELTQFPLIGAPLLLRMKQAGLSREEFVTNYQALFTEATVARILETPSGELKSFDVTEDSLPFLYGLMPGKKAYRLEVTYGQGQQASLVFGSFSDRYVFHHIQFE